MKMLWLLWFILLSSAYATPIPCTKFKAWPAIIDGCEGERCDSSSNEVQTALPLYAEHSYKSKIVANLKACEKVKSIQQKTIVLSPGKHLVSEENSDLKKYGIKKGDVLIAIQYRGEASYKYCIRDKLVELEDVRAKDITDGLNTDAWSLVDSFKGKGWAKDGDWINCSGCVRICKP